MVTDLSTLTVESVVDCAEGYMVSGNTCGMYDCFSPFTVNNCR